MSAQLSRRFGRVVSYPPLFGMLLEEKSELDHLTLQRQMEFEDLPERYQRLILEAVAAGTPHALDYLWDEAAAKAADELDARYKASRRKRASSRVPRGKEAAALASQ